MVSQQAFSPKKRKRTFECRMFGFLLLMGIFQVVPICSSVNAAFSDKNAIEKIPKASREAITGLKPSSEKLKRNSSISNENTLQRKSRALPIFEIFPNINAKDLDLAADLKESVHKLPTKSGSDYVIPHLRPGKKNSAIANENENSNDVGPILNKEEPMISDARIQRSYNIIPNVRFGRSRLSSNTYPNAKYPKNTLIPMARFGRDIEMSTFSDTPDANIGMVEGEANYHLGKNSYPETRLKYTNNKSNQALRLTDSEKARSYEEMIQTEKRSTADTDYVIPYPRLGKSISENAFSSGKESETLNQDGLSIIPQIRYGRSVSIFSFPKPDMTKQSEIPNLILPYPRPGRSETKSSEEEAIDIMFDEMAMNSKTTERNTENNRIKKEGYMLPYARLGRNGKNIMHKASDVNFDTEEDIVSFLKLNFSLNPENLSEQLLDEEEKETFFIIPYPRPGKRLEMRKSLIPNTRFGRNIFSANSQNKILKLKEKGSYDFVLPYPRPGKRQYDEDITYVSNLSEDDIDVVNESIKDETSSSDDVANLLVFSSNSIYPDGNYMKNNEIVNKRNVGSNYILPSFRPGRSLLPIPRPRRSLLPYPRPEISETVNFELSYPRNKRSETSILPYPRPGRQISKTFSPFKRAINKTADLFASKQSAADFDDERYFSSGSNSVIIRLPYNPFLRYPRPGRSGVDNVSFSILLPDGYKSASIAHPIVNKKASESGGFIVPFPRPGKSTFSTLVPYPRPDRSSSNEMFILPYPRPGRSTGLQNVRPKEKLEIPISSNKLFVLPYPRPGRSLQLGYSEPISDTNLLSLDSYHGFTSPYLDENMLSNSKFGDVDSYSRFSAEDGSKKSSGVPNARLGRSTEHSKGYVLPYPRAGRSTTTEKVLNGNSNTDLTSFNFRQRKSEFQAEPTESIPKYAHKLHKHMLTSNSNYILPYPRPGRFTE